MRPTGPILTVAFLALACGSSKGGTGQDHPATPALGDLKVTGRVVNEAGLPLAAIPLQALTVAPGREAECPGLPAAASCGAPVAGASDASGRFELTLPAAEARLVIAAEAGAGPGQLRGASSVMERTRQTAAEAQTLDLGDLILWQPALSWKHEGGVVTWRHDPLPEALDQAMDEQARFETPDGLALGVPVLQDWTELGQADARVFEDLKGGLAILAAPASDPALPRLRSATIGFEGPSGPAPTRGAPCWLTPVSGATEVVSPCPLTDGDLARAVGPLCKGTDCASVTLDLGQVRQLALVSLRYLQPNFGLDVSVNGSSWTTIVEYRKNEQEAGLFPVFAQPFFRHPARYVRVRGLSGGPAVGALSEVSVWSEGR